MRREEVTRPLERSSTTGAQESIPPNLREAPREHVVEKAREKRVDGKRDGSRLVGVCMGVPKTDVTVREAVESLIRERDTKDIAREIADRVRAGADRLHVHIPPVLPDPWRCA